MKEYLTLLKGIFNTEKNKLRASFTDGPVVLHLDVKDNMLF